MSTTKRIFNYDYLHPAWKNHEELLEHNGTECEVYTTDYGMLDIVRIVFTDGFEAHVFTYELERVK